MIPINSYDRLKNDVINRYRDHSDEEYVTFGILLADARQSETREYILNYLDAFDRHAYHYFDFFIPGYQQEEWLGGKRIVFRRTVYYFCNDIFDEFCENLEKDFRVRYTYNPMLILVSMKKGYIESAKHIVIELDNEGEHGVKRCGMLFDDIFEIARRSIELKDIQRGLAFRYIKANALDTIVDAIAPKWLCEIKNNYCEVKRYKIK